MESLTCTRFHDVGSSCCPVGWTCTYSLHKASHTEGMSAVGLQTPACLLCFSTWFLEWGQTNRSVTDLITKLFRSSGQIKEDLSLSSSDFSLSHKQQHLSDPEPENGPAAASSQGQVIPYPESLKGGFGWVGEGRSTESLCCCQTLRDTPWSCLKQRA